MIVRILLYIWLVLLTQNPAKASNELSRKPLKVGFLMGGPVTDFGWNQAHNNGRLYLEKYMAGKVKTIFAESVPENSEAGRVMERMIAQGAKIIFGTSYGYLDPILAVAARHPDVIFMQINRHSEQKRPNIGVYFPYYFEPLYSNGIVAGRITKTNKLGFIIGHAVPNLLAGVNAFTLGARSVNPGVKINLVCTNSWNDPTTEAEATKALVESGADIIASILDSSLTVCNSAAKLSSYCIGTAYDLNKQVPKAWLTGQSWNYGPLYVKIVDQVINSSWKPDTQYYTAKDGYAQLASFGSMVPQAMREEAALAFKKIATGKTAVFAGPIKDSSGKLRIPAGKVADNQSIGQMNWVVPGVEGALAK